MRIGVPKEIKNNEYRVGIVPGGVLALTSAGHEVFVQKDGGIGPGISNEQYKNAGARIIDTAAEIWDKADMIVKVKEPLPQEWKMMKKDQDDVVHYCVANMPGAVAGTSTYALTNATQPYIRKLAEGPLETIKKDKGLWQGVNCYKGKRTHKAVADAFNMEYTPLETLLK